VSDVSGKLGADRASTGRALQSQATKRASGLDANTINSMFPDAANAIAKKKAEYTQQTGNVPTSNRNSAVGDRSSLVAPTIATPAEGPRENTSAPQPSPTPWSQRHAERPKSSSGHPAMGQFSAPPPSAGLRSPRPSHLNPTAGADGTPATAEHPMLSPYNANASWASMTNTPMVANFNTQQPNNQADMVANATAMKLAALSTVNNRLVLDDVRKYQRRARSNDGQGGPQNNMLSAGMPPGNVVVLNENGQLVNASQLSQAQLMALQMQQQQAAQGQGRGGSRPNSPGIAMSSASLAPSGGPMGGFASPQNNGYLAASGLSGGMAGLDLSGGPGGPGIPGGHQGMRHGHEGYISDHSEMQRGRSPRGRRGTSKPPEDPTDPSLLNDIPAWLRSLRLHKYTDNLKDLEWKDLIQLDDKGLEDRGVNALGARRKMLKVS
jgi:SAM domain (Sterile alpha motif)